MKILYIHQYFKTPSEPGGTRSYWFCKELITQGFKVVMITSRNNQRKIILRENIDGIEVIYIRNKYKNNYGIVRRFISFINFMFLSSFVSLKEKEIRLAYITSTPLTVGFPALVLKKIKRINYLFEVRDLWPEVPIQMGGLNNSLLQKISRWFEKTVYKNALHIVALSPGMAEGIIKTGISVDKVSMIPNMSKNDIFFFREKNNEILKQYKLDESKFNVIHFGAMGIANGLEYIIDAALILKKKNISDIVFLFTGEGGMEKQLKKLVTQFDLNNVKFLGKFNMQEMSEIVNIADCSIVTFLDLPVLYTNSPNKLFDSLSAQKPIIVNSNGWTREMVEENNCGRYVSPKNPAELADTLIDWKNNPDKVKILGKNARILAEKKYNKTLLTKEFFYLIQKYI